MFGGKFVERLLRKFRTSRSEDIITTLTEFTALSVYDSYHRFKPSRLTADEVLVGGGGVHNHYLMNALQRYFGKADVSPMENAGMLSDAKEAICFAVLANETIMGRSSNVPQVTGASRATPLGVIALP